jgi:hypothetical protein
VLDLNRWIHKPSGFLKQSNDHSHRSGHNRHDCENYIPQLCNWDVFQVVFHFGFHGDSLAITRPRLELSGERGDTSASHTGPCEKIAVIFRLLEIERQSEMRPPPACQHYAQSDAHDCRYP